MKPKSDECTTAENLEAKFDAGEDVIDYFEPSEARVIRPEEEKRAREENALPQAKEAHP